MRTLMRLPNRSLPKRWKNFETGVREQEKISTDLHQARNGATMYLSNTSGCSCGAKRRLLWSQDICKKERLFLCRSQLQGCTGQAENQVDSHRLSNPWKQEEGGSVPDGTAPNLPASGGRYGGSGEGRTVCGLSGTLAEIAKSTIAITTYSSYDGMMKSTIVPWFRKTGVTITELTAQDIQDFYTAQLARVKSNTVIHYHALIHRALKYAVKTDQLSVNPADKVDRPRKNGFQPAFMTRMKSTSFSLA